MRVAVTGGTGFVGRAVCQALESNGHETVILSSSPHTHSQDGTVIRCVDYDDTESLKNALSDCRHVINLIGILHERGSQTFTKVHHKLVNRLLTAITAVGIKDYMHMSALGADAQGPSAYLKSKAEGEKSAFELCKKNTIRMISFRPSVIFGEHDHFFNQFAKILKYTPVMPLVCPQAKFQPVAVEDVASAILWGLESSVDRATIELGGYEVMTMQEVLERVCQTYGWKRLIIPLPDAVSKVQGMIMGFIPGAPFTHDNYLSMQKPNTTDQWPWPQMNIEPRAVTVHKLWRQQYD